jgi:hypothetical protein
MNSQENQTKSSVYQPTKCDMKYKEISQEDIPVCYSRMQCFQVDQLIMISCPGRNSCSRD